MQLYHLLRALRAHTALKMSVVLLNDGELANRIRALRIDVVVLDESKLSSREILRCLVKIVRDAAPDVVHTHRTKENILGSLASFLGGRRISVRTVHGSPEHTGVRNRLAAKVDQLAGRLLQKAVVSVSTELTPRLREIFGTKAVVCIPNGVDADFVRDQSALSGQLLADAQARICIIGRLVPVKRGDVFIAIAAELKRRHGPRIRCAVIGDGPLREELMILARELGVEKELDFLGFHSNCLPLLRQMDALLITSDHEGLPMVALEALALGVPVIAHAVGGLRELIKEPRQGALVPSQDVATFANAVDDVLSGRRTEGANLLEAIHTARHAALQYADLYARLTDGRAVGHNMKKPDHERAS